MCGIFGTVNFSKTHDPEVIFRSLIHRGPDEQNSVEINQICLFHTRLAIQDLTPAGSQPMVYNGLYITFNGEIYNHQELRKKYQLRHPSRSDTMTILMMYEKVGMKMLEEFDGMFAFCLYDTNHRKAYLVRDRAGKKPLYIWQKENKIVFSSELNALRQVTTPSINRDAVNEYLYLGYCFREQTVYNEIWELGNGSWLEIDLDSGKQRVEKWFDIAPFYSKKISWPTREILTELDSRLQDAIQCRLESSDVEVGTFLSGGIDSGLVTSIATRLKKNLRTFTIRIAGSYDESALAALVAKKYNTSHTTIDISFNHLQQDFEKIVTNYGEPFRESSAIPSYYVAKAARDHIKVVLNGDGADELFGGYRRYVPFRYFNFFSQSAGMRFTMEKLSTIMPIAHEKKNSYNHIYRLIKFGSYHDFARMYSAATTDLFVGYESAFLKVPELNAITEMLEKIAALKISGMSKILIADFNALLFCTLLPKMDIATMAHSLEGRSPFLSKSILEFAPTIPDKLKIGGVTTKYLLRLLAKKYLPPQLIHQPKRGFEVPLKNWMDNELKEILNDYLSSANPLYQEFIKRDFVDKLRQRKISISDEKRAKMLYSLLCLEVWHKNLATKENKQRPTTLKNSVEVVPTNQH